MEPNPAGKLLGEGFVCAESVLLAVCRETKIDFDERIIPRIAFGFAGGFGNTGAVCGAVVGAVMAISLHLPKTDDMEQGLRSLQIVAELRRRFEAEMETIFCRELTGADLTTPEGIQRFMDSEAPQTVCFPAVGVAYKLAMDLISEMGK